MYTVYCQCVTSVVCLVLQMIAVRQMRHMSLQLVNKNRKA